MIRIYDCLGADSSILIGVGVSRTVVTSIADTVAIYIFLKRVVVVRAVVLEIFLSIVVRIYDILRADSSILIRIRVSWTVVAYIADTVAIAVFLKRVVVVRAVVLEIFLSIVVRIYDILGAN